MSHINRHVTIIYRGIEFVTWISSIVAWNLSRGYRLSPHRICHVVIVNHHIVIAYCHIVVVYHCIDVVTCSSSHSSTFRATVHSLSSWSIELHNRSPATVVVIVNVVHLPTIWLLGATVISIATHSQLIVVGFGRFKGPRLLWVILKCYGQRGSPFICDELMLGCEEKNLGRVLPPAKFFSNKAYLHICSSILVETLCYHIPSIRNEGAAYAAVRTDTAAVQTDAVPAAVQTDAAPAAVQTDAAPAAVQTDVTGIYVTDTQ